MNKNMKIFGGMLTAFFTAFIVHPMAMAAYPDRPITLIVPFPPGGSTDVVARILANKASVLLGQKMIVENRPGAGTVIGSRLVAKAAPDGYTLLMGNTSLTVNASLLKDLPYDTVKDFTPIAFIASTPGAFLAQAQKPYKTFKEFVDYTRANPGTVVYSSAGIGSWPHLSMEMLANTVGLKMLHVPYQGTGPAKADLIAGRVDVKIEGYVTSKDMVQDGRLNVLAVTGAKRAPYLPNVPTVAELGYPEYESIYWLGIVGPAGMPADVVATLEKVMLDICKDPEFIKDMTDRDVDVQGQSAKGLRIEMDKQIAKWKKVIEQANVQAQ
jgi:tripartite-type tricarboxylate transporter receptor subunit TctC